MLDSRGFGADTYLNPVYSKSFPDPFVLKFSGEYFAYCTGFAADGNVFEVLRSNDLVNWSEISGAMKPLENSPPYYWAPEVTYDNGNFYLYYSVGNEALMELRVAVSDRPDGGFVDSGKRLTSEDFAIDAHVFVDHDGTRYLFYATDFLKHSHIGTGTVMDRMIDWFTLEGNPRPVTRARYDWQVYDPERKEKGGVRWHTVEGPAVLNRKGLYYEMFSGGNWQNTTYGVSFAVTDGLQIQDEWMQFSDGENALPILRTIPGTVVGPGHNCVVRGPNNRELYCVYHRWIEDRRVMAIDRMDFAGKRIFVVGASHTPQPVPFEPRIKERFHNVKLAPGIAAHGDWSFTESGAVSGGDVRSEIKVDAVPESFLIELTWAMGGGVNGTGRFGIALKTSAGLVEFAFSPNNKTASFSIDGASELVELPHRFEWTASHLIAAEVDCHRLALKIDDGVCRLNRFLGSAVTDVAIFSESQSVVLTSLELTEGYEELFDNPEPLTENGWKIETDGTYRVEHKELVLDSREEYLITKGAPLSTMEFAANFRTLEETPAAGAFGLTLMDENGESFGVTVNCEQRRIETDSPANNFHSLPADIQLSEYHQVRIIKTVGNVICYIDDVCVGRFSIPETHTVAAIFCRGVRVGVEMIRLTSI